MKIGAFFLELSNEDTSCYANDKFFSPNAINSFKKWHPDIDIIHVTNDVLDQYLKDLDITEPHKHVGLIRVQIIHGLLKLGHYDKIIMLGLDTFTCSYLDDLIENNTDDLICSSGPPYSFMGTEYWTPKVINFNTGFFNGADIDFINADVACFNTTKGAKLLIDKTIEFFTHQSEQGGMNYIYQNQNDLDIKVSIIDFPYLITRSLYNVRSKGLAVGGNQQYRGKLYSGHYKDPQSHIVSSVYPTSEYYIRHNQLFTKDNKQIKVFHYAEDLGNKNDEEYSELVEDIKTNWFNPKTKDFLINQCNCKF